MPPKIFIGTKDTAKNVTNLTEGFRRLGYEADSFVSQPHPLYDNATYTYSNIRLENGVSFFEDKNQRVQPAKLNHKILSLMKKYDIFIFVAGSSLLPRMFDLATLKSMGKTIIARHCGTDVRDTELANFFCLNHKRKYTYYANDKACSKIEINREMDLLNVGIYHPHIANKLHNIRMSETYASLVSCGSEANTLGIRPYFQSGPIFNAKECSIKFNKRKKHIICHFPSSLDFKNSKLILATLEELKAEGLEFDVNFQTRIPHHEVLKYLTDSDILIDQISCGTGVLSYEGNASGCAVISGHTGKESPLPRHRVICNAYENNLKEQIRRVVLDMNYRTQLVEEGKEFVDSGIGSPESVAAYLLEGLEKEKKGQADVYPTLFTSSSALLKRESANIPKYLKEMTVDILKKYGTHEDTKVKNLLNSGMITDPTLEDSDIWRWDSSKLQEDGPFVLTHKDATYGLKK
jgi:hypothetical protein